MLTRRGFVGLSVAVGAGVIGGFPILSHAQQQTYPFSAGSNKPKITCVRLPSPYL